MNHIFHIVAWVIGSIWAASFIAVGILAILFFLPSRKNAIEWRKQCAWEEDD